MFKAFLISYFFFLTISSTYLQIYKAHCKCFVDSGDCQDDINGVELKTFNFAMNSPLCIKIDIDICGDTKKVQSFKLLLDPTSKLYNQPNLYSDDYCGMKRQAYEYDDDCRVRSPFSTAAFLKCNYELTSSTSLRFLS